MKEKVWTSSVFALLAGLFTFAANDWKVPWVGTPARGPDWCAAHETALSTCELCNPKLARGGTYTLKERDPKEGECPNTVVRVHLGPGVAEEIGLATLTVEMRPVSESLRRNAETMFPPSHYARVAPRIPGIVREIKAVLGQDVEAGAVLAVLESAEFAQAKADYLQALAVLHLREKTHEQEKTLFDKKITTGRELLQAATDLEEARLAVRRENQRLSVLGVTADQVKILTETEDTSPLLEVRAPFAGRIVEVAAVPGERAGPEKPLFYVACLERFWIAIDAYEADLSKIEKDQRVTFTVEGFPGKRFPGRVLAIGGEVDDRTRTVRVYADVKNVDGLLRARMFGRAEIAVKPPEPKLLVPKESVQHDGDCYLVFVSPVPNVFQARKVEIGTVYEGGYEIAGGLAPGEKIATTGSFLLKAEVLRSQMGAG